MKEDNAISRADAATAVSKQKSGQENKYGLQTSVCDATKANQKGTTGMQKNVFRALSSAQFAVNLPRNNKKPDVGFAHSLHKDQAKII